MKTKGRGKGSAQGPTKAAEHIVEGHGVAPGIAIGRAFVVEHRISQIPEYSIGAAEVAAECQRFNEAVAYSQRQVGKLQDKARRLSGAAAEELGYILEANLQMLSGSRLVRGVEERIGRQRINAEAAVQAEMADISLSFSAIGDPYLAARMQDINDVGMRLIRSLTNTPYKALSGLPEGTVVIAEEITPADTALMDPARIAGFATALGGAESHTAIVARSLGLPAVLGAADVVTTVKTGDTLVIDGGRGRIVVNPTSRTKARFRQRRQELAREQRLLARLRDLPAESRDGVEVTLQANLELPLELGMVKQVGAAGIGLLRSEFFFMNRDDLPSQDEQYTALSALVEGMAGRPVTIRTLDVGGEKLAPALGQHFETSANPALGLRAIRLSLKVRSLLEDQLAAILRAGAHGPVRILLPMITTPGEVVQVRQVLKRVARRLKRRGQTIAAPLPPLGVLIEVPAAALAADGLAQVADFFSIGTNDLTMYTLAIDRSDEQMADQFNSLHPAVIRLVGHCIEAARRADVPINLCGEMAGEPRYTALLLGLGLRDLSMAATALPRVKQRIHSLDVSEATRRSQRILEQHDSGRIVAMLDDLNALI